MSFRAKIFGLSLLGIVVTAAIIIAVLVVQKSRSQQEITAQLDQLSRQESAKIAKDVYLMLRVYHEKLQRELRNDLSVARHRARRAGGVSFAKEKRSWDIVNQFTAEHRRVELPTMKVATAPLVPHSDDAGAFPVVDDVYSLVRGTCTIFQRINGAGDMLRVCTNVRQADGTRAIGTYIPAINTDGKRNSVVSAVLRGETFVGRAYVVNDWYLTAYEPIRDAQSRITGMLYVGVIQEDVPDLRKGIGGIVVGKTGYINILGGSGDQKGRFIMSYRGERNGQYGWDDKDADGKDFCKSMIQKALSTANGECAYESYRWRNPGEKAARRKTAAVSYFEPWDWMIVAGAYEDDYRDAVDEAARSFDRLLVGTVLASILAAISCCFVAHVVARKIADRQALTVRRLEGVNRLQEELLLPGPLAEKFKKITDAAVSVLELDFCRIWSVLPGDLCDSGCIHASSTDENHLCRRRDRCLHLMASSGRYTGTDGFRRRVPLGHYKVGMIATGEERKMVSNSVTNDPRIINHEWARSLGLVSFAGYRLHDVRGDTTGVLAMFAKHPLSEEDDAFLSHLAETTSKVIVDHAAEEELRQAHKLEGVGQLAGGVAHEFNNLLQVIDGYAYSGMLGLDPEEERYDDLTQIRKAAETARALTSQLLGFSRRRAIQPKSNDANLVVRDLVKLIRPTIGAHITLELALGDGVGTVYVDSGELQQALLNLCINARDAMPAGGTLLLRTDTTVLTEPCWDAQFDIKPGRYVVFSVSDTGCGISRDIQQHIFEPFFTTKDVGKGTGLGLALVYGVVRQHKGAIHVYSEVGIGTTFKLFLPASEGEADEDHVEEAGLAQNVSETILVAEDDPAIRNFSVRILERAGYTVLTAADGEEAWRMFEEHCRTIDLVLLDAVIPKLMGHEVRRRINEISSARRSSTAPVTTRRSLVRVASYERTCHIFKSPSLPVRYCPQCVKP